MKWNEFAFVNVYVNANKNVYEYVYDFVTMGINAYMI